MDNSGNTGNDFDLEIALSHVGGDVQLLAELASLFLQDYPRLLEEMRESIRKGNDSVLERTAHTLKGRLAFFGVGKAREHALALEMMGRNHSTAHAEQVLAEIETEMNAHLPEFDSMAKAQNP